MSIPRGPRGVAFISAATDSSNGYTFTREDGYVSPPTPSVHAAVKISARARALSVKWFLG